ncbi:hypothetical protein BS17DRAFT_771761 [Gyrodon lividus]|nr:hypothetical protein BS17DRAFT_771761 [Gyrodon lividus]
MSSGLDSSNGTMEDMMIPWLHIGGGDFLLFKTWQPSSHGAIAGSCIGLLVFCVLERFLAAYRRTQELRWRARALGLVLKHHSASRLQSSNGAEADKVKSQDPGDVISIAEEALQTNESSGTVAPVRMSPRLIPPFIPSHDIPRGIIQAIQTTFSYALMLAVMTFNGAYIISVILGLGIGEMLFGRIGRV